MELYLDARRFFHSGLYAAAVETFSLAARLDPRHADSFLYLGLT
jgi:hypothetical protein